MGASGEESLFDLLEQLAQFVGRSVPEPIEDARRRRTARSSADVLAVPGTTAQVQKVAKSLRDAYDNMLWKVPVEDRAESVRETMIRLLEEAQVSAARLRALILFLADRLPQPYSELSESAACFGKEASEALLQALRDAFQCPMESHLGSKPLGSRGGAEPAGEAHESGPHHARVLRR